MRLMKADFGLTVFSKEKILNEFINADIVVTDNRKRQKISQLFPICESNAKIREKVGENSELNNAKALNESNAKNK